MISIVRMELEEYTPVEISTTIFPDGTSQVWKIDVDKMRGEAVTVVWEYEQEVELIWLNQLLVLLYQSNVTVENLLIPYLPYARQDKQVSDTRTFAREVFLELLLKEYVVKVSTLDVHSPCPSVHNYYPWDSLTGALSNFIPTHIVFPDKGSKKRYHSLFGPHSPYSSIVLDKDRDQLTGKINSLVISEEHSDKILAEGGDLRFLIVDDISDYGGTFKKAAKFLRETYVDNITIGLYVTHFLGHGDLNEFAESGISSIYTSDSLSAYRKFKGINDLGLVKIFASTKNI